MDERPDLDAAAPADDRAQTRHGPVILLCAVIVALAAVTASLLLPREAAAPATSAGTLTTRNNDAVADYQSALANGRPIFVLFHSLS